MKVALVSSFVPFVNGGYRNIVEWLEHYLREHGHQVERVYLPHVDGPENLLTQMSAYRWVDLDAADRVICFRPPAHAIEHSCKVLWFIHHIRPFYDLWDSPYRGFPDDVRHRALRDILHSTDTAAMHEAKSIFTNSQIVGRRLKKFNGIDSEVLYPPVFESERFNCRGFNDEVVYICRLEHHKRQHLLIEAMRYTKTPVRLRICGSGSGNGYSRELQLLVVKHNLKDKVVVENNWITEEHKVNLLANCLAAAYLPVDEDSYGYPSLEAFHSAKPVLTTTDSGGVLELVQHEKNGLVCSPTPLALAQALDRLYEDRADCQRMGNMASTSVDALGISWPHAVNRLLA